MVCSDRLARATPQQISLATLIVILGVAGISMVMWMAATGWADLTGLAVGIIFILLTVVQIVFAIVWWKGQARSAKLYEVQEQELEKMKEKEEESPKVASTGSGDSNAENSAQRGLMTDEVRLCYTDGAQKIDAEMVAV